MTSELPSGSSPASFRPTALQIAAAAGKGVPDIVAPGLQVWFCGINPSLYSAAMGHHFGRPGNRFWPVLYRAGITERLFSPAEDGLLLERGYGITNLVERATAAAAELSSGELLVGRKRLEERVRAYRPRVLAVLGVETYRSAFGRPRAALGRQAETIGANSDQATIIWLLPNPSGLNAHYRLDDLTRLYREVLVFCLAKNEEME